MGKTYKGKAKAKAKIAKARAKVARKAKRGFAAAAAALALAALAGCATGESTQPAKSQTMENTFKDCIIVVATQCSVSNRVVTADGTKDVPAVELFTQTQSLENAGTESTSQTATQTPTTDVKPDIDVEVPVTKGAAANAAADLIGAAASALKGSGSADCSGGACNPGGACTDGSCSD